MSIFAGARKYDLKILAEELGETVNDSHKLKDLKKMILASKEYDEESAKEWLNTIINERKEREENERRNEEIQIEERWRKEEQEYDERKRKDEMEFELQKIRLGAEGNKAINCVAKESNHSSDESLSVRQVGEKLDKSNSFLKKAKLNNCDNVQALMDTGSSYCLLKISVAQKLKLKIERAVNKIYGFGNQKMPALTSIGRIIAYIEVDNVKAENISIYVVPDDVQSVDLIIGRTWLNLPHIAYTKMGKRVHIGYREDELFRNFPIDEKVNRVCLKRLETAQLESESLQIKDTSQQRMMGNLADEPSNGRLYATTAHVSQLKAWKSWNEDDDDSSENSDDEPEMQRPK
ncbi:hypothetical protein AVEN_237337-1 [Araneus ventricosus]|uniref:Peptidase A2 domain-containing protein n=1 Tax=Araneus ventricosus TaxID=182803 RepID=A0A4Y2M6K1_ARAVE|nr:hypothetical protein AVEN_237337-1 [Araneus ventricosus]